MLSPKISLVSTRAWERLPPKGPLEPPAQVGSPRGWVISYLKAHLTLQDFFLLGEGHRERRAEGSSGPLVIAETAQGPFYRQGLCPHSPLQLAQHAAGVGSLLAIPLPSVLMKADWRWQVPCVEICRVGGSSAWCRSECFNLAHHVLASLPFYSHPPPASVYSPDSTLTSWALL